MEGMDLTASDNVIGFSTHHLADRHREEVIREFYGRICMRLDLEPLDRAEFRLNASTVVLPGVHVTQGSVSPMDWRRTPGLMSDGNDALAISWIAGGWRFHNGDSRSPVVETEPGAPCVMPLDQPWHARTTDGTWTTCIQVSRSLIEPLVPNVSDTEPGAIRSDSAEGQLLFDYVQSVHRIGVTPGLAPLTAQHIIDLTAAAIGASRDVMELVHGRGIRSARLAAVKRHIEANLRCSRLSAETAARALGLSPRYIRDLFSTEGQTFSEYVTERRLLRIHRQLCDPRYRHKPIADIAFEAGLVEPSTFYRQFKARYGMKPSDARAAALQQGLDGVSPR